MNRFIGFGQVEKTRVGIGIVIRAGFPFVAQPDVQRHTAADLPIVVNENADEWRAHGLKRKSASRAALIDHAEEERGVRIAG